ncbi:lipoprotein [Salinisphaera sp. PC39]|uniref:hypothetical protein n=1 Tax=Salinisphaera sp. PC39 TaxID=1304156 RepID=UPI003340CDB7
MPMSRFLLAAAVVLAAGNAAARNFTHTYEATIADPDEVEYAQWATLSRRAENDRGLTRLDFRHELEAGLSERWQAALYLDWRYLDSDVEPDDDMEFLDVAAESIYQISDPTSRPWGLALYGEVKLGDEIVALEPKLIVQKNLGPWILAWNLAAEAEWEGRDYEEDNAVVGQTLGISRRLGGDWRLGAEFTHEVEYADCSGWESPVVYGGPALSYHGHEWWFALSPMTQLSDVDDEADIRVRLILGVEFE